MLYPVEEINAKIAERDFQFFLAENNFLKVVDTLEKYQERVIDLDTQQGRDFVVFKRQLFQMYEVQNRTVGEHEAYSFNIERENLKLLSNANRVFLQEMDRLNKIDDLRAHANLNGAIFRRKPLSLKRYTGLASFGLAGLTYSYFPQVAGLLGKNLTWLGVSGLSFYGMVSFREHNVVNSISIISEGENQGKLKINVSSSLLTSRDIIVDVNNTQAVYSFSNDDLAENDVENNVIRVTNYLDCATN